MTSGQQINFRIDDDMREVVDAIVALFSTDRTAFVFRIILDEADRHIRDARDEGVLTNEQVHAIERRPGITRNGQRAAMLKRIAKNCPQFADRWPACAFTYPAGCNVTVTKGPPDGELDIGNDGTDREIDLPDLFRRVGLLEEKLGDE